MKNPKEAAGRRAADYVKSGMVVGLGTGSTVWYTLERLAERIRDEGLVIRGVPTSVDTEQKARQLGIPLVRLEDVERIDLTIDGADEIDGEFQMIKGGGGALLREKVVAYVSTREIIVVGRNKVVDCLGTTFALPVEVVPFARVVVERAIRRLGGQIELRRGTASTPYNTDNGNLILDCRFEGGIRDARGLAEELDRIPGVVETGLFLNFADVAVIGEESGECEVREKSEAARGSPAQRS